MNNLDKIFNGIDTFTLLMYISLFLSIAIFLSIIFGCTYKKRFESFENEKSTSSPESKKAKSIKKSDNKSKDKEEEDDDDELSVEEFKIIENLQSGKMSEVDLEKLIKDNKISTDSIEKMIKNVQTEMFKNKKK